MSNVVTIDHDPQEPPRSTALTPLAMLDNAIARGADPTTMERLMGLYERWEAGQARKAFDAAIAAAKAEMAPVVKNKAGHNGKRYASFDAIARAIDPILSRHGLSYRFRTTQTDRIAVTCVLSHRDGHSEETTLAGPPDASGSKNAIQAIGSTLSYLCRYSLTQAVGLAITEDDDGKAAGGDGVISDEQAAEIRGLLTETRSNLDQFLKLFNAESVPDLRASQYADAKGALLRKKEKQRREASQ